MDNQALEHPGNASLPQPPAVITARQDVTIVDGEHRQLEPVQYPATGSAAVQTASEIAYSAVGGIIILVVAAAFVTLIVWFVSDLAAVGSHTAPTGVDATTYSRNLIITAAANFLANLVLVLILVQVFSAVIGFLRTRHASARPILLIPLFIVMRAIIVIGSQLLLLPPPPAGSEGTTTFIELLVEMGVFALVGLTLSIALAVLRDPAQAKSAE